MCIRDRKRGQKVQRFAPNATKRNDLTLRSTSVHSRRCGETYLVFIIHLIGLTSNIHFPECRRGIVDGLRKLKTRRSWQTLQFRNALETLSKLKVSGCRRWLIKRNHLARNCLQVTDVLTGYGQCLKLRVSNLFLRFSLRHLAHPVLEGNCSSNLVTELNI